MRRNPAEGPTRRPRRPHIPSFWTEGLPQGAQIIEIDEDLDKGYLDAMYLDAFNNWPVATKKERSQSEEDGTGEVENPSATTKKQRNQSVVIDLLDESDNDADSDNEGAKNGEGGIDGANGGDDTGEVENDKGGNDNDDDDDDEDDDDEDDDDEDDDDEDDDDDDGEDNDDDEDDDDGENGDDGEA